MAGDVSAVDDGDVPVVAVCDVVSAAEQAVSLEIRRRRLAAGLSQNDLAARVAHQRQYISRAEQPKRGLPSENLVIALDQGLGADGELVRLWTIGAAERQRRRDGEKLSGNVPEVRSRERHQAGTAPRPGTAIEMAAPVLAVSARATEHRGIETDAMAADASSAVRFARTLTSGSVSAESLYRIEEEVRRLAHDYVAQPVVDLLGEIRGLHAEVVGMVEVNRSPTQLRVLHLQAGYLGGLHAYACLDLGHFRAAAAQARTAWLCADLAEHDDARAWVRALQSVIAYWEGDHHDAVHHARDGERYARRGSITVRLPSLHARAAAQLGDHGAVTAALARAERARDVADTAGETGVFTFPPAKQAAYAGTALLALSAEPHVRAAISCSTRALQTYQSGTAAERSPGDMHAARLDLATAHLSLGELDAVRDYLAPVLATPPQRRTATVRSRTARLAAGITVSPWSRSRDAIDTQEQLRAFCAEPVAVPDREPA